jgi:hypothetical protein
LNGGLAVVHYRDRALSEEGLAIVHVSLEFQELVFDLDSVGGTEEHAKRKEAFHGILYLKLFKIWKT